MSVNQLKPDPFDLAIREVIADLLGNQAMVRRQRNGSLRVTPRPGRPLLIEHHTYGLRLVDMSHSDTKWWRLFPERRSDQTASLDDPGFDYLKNAISAFGYSPDWDY
jgi:hypothetical protein